MRVLIVDDHYMVRQGLAFSFKAFEDIQLVGQASDGNEAISQCLATQPDVMLIDLMMPGMDAIEAIQAIHKLSANIRIIALIGLHSHIDTVQSALNAGASTCLPKTSSVEQLIWTIYGEEATDAIRGKFAG